MIVGRICRLDNTKLAILNRMRPGGTITPEQIVRALWPLSKQPEKKTQTIVAHLQALARSGHIRQAGKLWIRVHSSGRRSPR